MSKDFPFESDSRTTCGACSSGVEGSWNGQGWPLAAGCVDVSGGVRVLLGWVLVSEDGTESRQGFGTLAGRVCVSVLVVVGIDESSVVTLLYMFVVYYDDTASLSVDHLTVDLSEVNCYC